MLLTQADAGRGEHRYRRALALQARAAWPSLALVAVFVLSWQLAVVVLDPAPVVLPSPAAVARTLAENAQLLLEQTVVTATGAFAAFGLSIAVGVPVGVLAVKSQVFAKVVYPFVIGSQAVPKLALAPLFAVWLGIGLLSEVLVAFLIAFFPIAISTAVGLASVDRNTTLLARVLGLGRLSTFRRIELPAALPDIFGGLRVAIGFAVIGAVVGELIGARAGLGWLTLTASQTLKTDLLIATLIAAGALGLASYALVAVVEQLAIPWREKHSMTGTVSV